MDRAGPDDHEQAMIGAVQDVADDFPALGHGAQGSVAQGNIALELVRRDEGLVGGDVKVVDR
ncbi:hypothetical protein D3C80_2192530 [compost metagenome]